MRLLPRQQRERKATFFTAGKSRYRTIFAVTGQTPDEFLDRHVKGDWGELDEEDRQANDDALIDGSRILSSYRLSNGTKIWIITEWDRSATTCLLPEDY